MAHWNITIDLKEIWAKYNDGEFVFEEARDETVRKIKESDWRGLTADPEYLDFIVDAVEKAETRPEFNIAFDSVYDLADSDRVWIETC